MQTLGTLVLMLRLRLDEVSSSRWTDEQLRRWINEGVRDLTRATEWKQSTFPVFVPANTQTVNLSIASPGVYRIYRIEWQPSGDTRVFPLEFRPYHSMDQFWGAYKEIAVGYPQFFSTDGAPPSLQVILWPKPSTAGTLNVFYYGAAKELAVDGTDDNTPVDLPDGWEDLVLDYAEYRAFRADGRVDEALVSRQEYEQKREALRSSARFYTDRSTFMDSYYDGVWTE